MSHPSSSTPDPSNTSSVSTSKRVQQPSAWGPRRGLTPLATQSAQSQVRSGTSSPSRQVLSPTISAFNPPGASSRQVSSRHSSVSSSSSLFSPLTSTGQTGSQSRPRNVTSSGSPRLGASAGGGFGSQSNGSIGTSRLARQSPSLSISTTGSPTSSGPQSGASSGQLTSLVITQLNILLSTIREIKDRTKWEAQADKIWKLVDASGMEVFTHHFRRLLISNASTIFTSPTRSTEGAGGSYELLAREMQKLSTDSEQAVKIAESLDTSDGDIFKDFDLSAFMDHFRLHPILRTSLALACKSVSKPEIKSKAEAILTSHTDEFISALASPTDASDNFPPVIIASLLDRLANNPPRTWNEDKKSNLQLAIRLRYNKLGASLPYAVGAALALVDLCSTPNPLVKILQQGGARSTHGIDACKDLLAKADASAMGYHQVADALIYMAASESSGDRYDVSSFVTAVRQHRSGQRLDWQDVVSAFDRPELRVTKAQFLTLYNALLPLAKESETFDIQALWGNNWSNADAQLSFVVGLLSTTANELDASQIPRLRPAFTLKEFADASDEIKEHTAKAVLHPMVSYDATAALFTTIFSSQEAYNTAQSLSIPEGVINANTDIFVCAASAVAKPWSALQEQALKQLFQPFFSKMLPNSGFVMHALWMHDKTWLAGRLIEHYNANAKNLPMILDHAREHGWVDTLTSVRNDFGLDFTALAHSEGLVDIEKWALDHTEANKVRGDELSRAIIGFLRFKIEDEGSQNRDGTSPLTTVPLKIKTVSALLNVIQGTVTEAEEGAIQRQCIAAYPRLINYGYKFDAIIDANGEHGNGTSGDADAKMQEFYKDMYSGDADARKMINTLRTLRDSEDPGDQELFACMIHGLFDEYNCFGEYPLEALATTAVLFGGIINYGILHSRITLSVALIMVVDALANYAPEDSMYKFGLQASLHFIGRLEEWPQLCDRLCKIPGLRGTEVYTKAEEVIRSQGGMEGDADGKDLTLANGNADEFDVVSGYQPFSSITADPVLRSEFYEEPDEETSDKVTFVLNNVSKRNIEEKFKELEGHLDERFHQWFANYLVENLAKSQPNFQQLYLQLLGLFDRKILWAEVIRETYVSIARIINAEATSTSSSDRTNLKNLAIWLGLLTLARDKPILHRNIAFKELLIEAHQTQRLLVALPFTCKTLQQAAHSTVFQPPNPWLMELVGLMMELYHFAELKLNLKFEIEVLCKELGLDHNKLEPADIIRSLPLTAEETFMQPYAPEVIDGFGDMLGLSKRANDRFSPQDVMKSLPDLSTVLNFPPPPGNVSQQQIKNVFLTAAQRAIQEIITPVVDRSVTIAAISTAQIIEKDFAMDADVEKLQHAAYTVVKALSGSLALVTCKEPLRMSITNNIRLLAAQHLPDQMPEGTILMFTNDNLDAVCKLVEDSAEHHSMAEVDAQLEQAIEARRQHRQQRPHEPFNHPPVSRWAFFVPEPFKQEQGGLNAQQLSIYEDFGRHVRAGPLSHGGNMSIDSSRQITDVLSEGYLPSMPTPAETPALPRQALQQHRMQPPSLQNQQAHQVNGFVDVGQYADRLAALLEELVRVTREAPEEIIRDLPLSSPTRDVYEQIVRVVDSSGIHKDQLALNAGQKAVYLLYHEADSRLEMEVLVQFLTQLCTISAPTARQLTLYLSTQDDNRAFDAVIDSCLLKSGLVDFQQIDAKTAKALTPGRDNVLEYFKQLTDELMPSDSAGAMRTEFILSFGAIGQWLADDENHEEARALYNKLDQSSQLPNGVSAEASKRDTMEYAFEEWVSLQRPNVSDSALGTYIEQLHSRGIISEANDFKTLIRAACEASVQSYQQEAASGGNIDNAYVNVDAWAKLIAALVAFFGDDDDGSPILRLQFAEDMLCTVLLLFNHSYQQGQDKFESKIFYRFFSSALIECHGFRAKMGPAGERITGLFGEAILALQPKVFPAFAFSWVSLISHRSLADPLLHQSEAPLVGEGPTGWNIMTKLVCAALSYIGDVQERMETSITLQDLYRAILKVICIIQHDHPEYLAKNHMFLNSAISDKMVQLLNVINCANPSSIQELPDPFTPGLKINRLDQVRQTPVSSADSDLILSKAGIRPVFERLLSTDNAPPADITELATALANPPSGKYDFLPSPEAERRLVANALMISLGNTATIASSTFSASAPQAKLIERLLSAMAPRDRYTLICAMANQIRYPSSHTHYFSTATLHLFTTASEDVQQQLARVLVERLLVARPHPWGLIVTILELIKNARYNVFEQRWMKAAPEVERLLGNIAQAQVGTGTPPR